MKQSGAGRTLVWMAAGSAVLAAGAFLGAITGRRRECKRDRGGRIETSEARIEAVCQELAALEERVVPQVSALQARVNGHQTVIEQLQVHATQTEANLQRMIAAVEKLTYQISQAVSAGLRIEPKKETPVAPQEERILALK